MEPLQTVFDIKNRRALVVEGHEDAIMTLTTVADAAAVIARAVDYEGEWPTTGGICGNRVSVSQIIEIASKVRGMKKPRLMLVEHKAPRSNRNTDLICRGAVLR